MMQLGSTSSSSQARSYHPSVLEHDGVGDGQDQAEAVLLWLEARSSAASRGATSAKRGVRARDVRVAASRRASLAEPASRKPATAGSRRVRRPAGGRQAVSVRLSPGRTPIRREDCPVRRRRSGRGAPRVLRGSGQTWREAAAPR